MELLNKYKNVINSLMQKNINDKEETIKKLLVGDLNTGKIEQDEYNELLNYINSFALKTEREIQKQNPENELSKNKKDNSNINSELKREDILKFRDSLTIKFTPIYKGKWGKMAPSIRRENRSVDSEWEK